MNNMLLTITLFSPLLGALLVYFLASDDKKAKTIAVLASLIPLISSILLLLGYNWQTSSLQFVEEIAWIKDLGISYFLGVDGLSMPLVFLTTLLTSLTLLFSWDVKEKVKEYLALLLILETGVIGVFVALDFFLFYLFWEIVLIPMYFLILEWGGPRRKYASMKFFIYTHIASLFMLVGIIAVYFAGGEQLGYYSFNMFEIIEKVKLDEAFQLLIFPLLFFGFAVKLPLVPFHTWLPDAHVEAPTGGSIMLAGVLLKMGGYGLIRIGFTMFPHAVQSYAYIMAILGVISMVYGAFLALAQDDLKKMVAYSSVSHMGYVVLGLAALNASGFNGAIFQMFAHGIISAMLFMVCGIVQHNFQTRRISLLGGIGNKVPKLTAFVVFSFMASLGLPGLAGFVAEFNVFVGAFSSYVVLAVIALASLLITAGYYLWSIERAFYGPYKERLDRFNPKDITWYQAVPLALLSVLVIFFGVYPAPLMEMINANSQYVLEIIGGAF